MITQEEAKENIIGAKMRLKKLNVKISMKRVELNSLLKQKKIITQDIIRNVESLELEARQ